MQAILEFQMPIMLFFQNLRNPALDVLATICTWLADPMGTIAILIFLYWCIDKKKGFALGASVLSSQLVLNVLKLLFLVPRPFVLHPEKIKPMMTGTATGYSFPSGHSANAGNFYGFLYLYARKKPLKILCASLVILVPISRLYVGVHWPTDVLVGTAIGITCAFIGGRYYEEAYSDREKLKKFAVIMGTLGGVVAVGDLLIILTGKVDSEQWKDLMEIGAMMAAFFPGVYLERTRLNFLIPKTVGRKLLTMVGGLVPGMALWYLIRIIPLNPYVMKLIAYAFIAFWASFLFPWLAVRQGFFQRAGRKAQVVPEDLLN